jgi:hypothetical protein
MEDLRAFLERHRTPGLEALLGGVDRGVRLVDAAAGNLRDRLFVDRRDVGEGRAGRDALAADPVVGRDLNAPDLNSIARAVLPETRSYPNGMDDPRALSNRPRCPVYASRVGGRPWRGWILLGLSAGLILVAIAEWER